MIKPAPAVRFFDSSGAVRVVVVGDDEYAAEPGGQWVASSASSASFLGIEDVWNGFHASSAERPPGGGCHLKENDSDGQTELWIGPNGLPDRATVTHLPCSYRYCPSVLTTDTCTYSQVNQIAPISRPPASATWHGDTPWGTVGQRVATTDGGAVTVLSAGFVSGPPDPSLPPSPPPGLRYAVAEVLLENTADRAMPYSLATGPQAPPPTGIALASPVAASGSLAPKSTVRDRLVLKVTERVSIISLSARLGFARADVENLVSTAAVTVSGQVGQSLQAHGMTVTVTSADLNRPPKLGDPVPAVGTRTIAVQLVVVARGDRPAQLWTLKGDGLGVGIDGSVIPDGNGGWQVVFESVPKNIQHLVLRGILDGDTFVIPLR